ncbi:hypothetical protein P175DRAFT_0500147 [Aspergillus ochraceoroseus IBT 24754]|uniref:Uncharacterized protein n=1 Tax=Aspergillus ochraceoroseus IBT 24754 TaxID=1392256 RepID=A0A2T5M4Z7_9EURO|nr:uncharacterized protein P175DRAFT_0500147 [Aspergillus ochraceoroseus IBT 24754]PTU23584.1 hypothetical protein P175DRAFT_0500147 [Aspergillus ochraceoroseus IBT 24754]
MLGLSHSPESGSPPALRTAHSDMQEALQPGSKYQVWYRETAFSHLGGHMANLGLAWCTITLSNYHHPRHRAYGHLLRTGTPRDQAGVLAVYCVVIVVTYSLE